MANERTNPRHYVCLSKRGKRERERERENKKNGIASLPPPLSLSLSLSVCLYASVCLSLSLRKFCLLGNTTGTPSSASSGTPRDTRVTCYLLVDRCRQPTRVESSPRSAHISPHAHTIDFVEHEGRRVTTVWYRQTVTLLTFPEMRLRPIGDFISSRSCAL